MNPNEKYLYAADDFWKDRANLEYDYVLNYVLLKFVGGPFTSRHLSLLTGIPAQVIERWMEPHIFASRSHETVFSPYALSATRQVYDWYKGTGVVSGTLVDAAVENGMGLAMIARLTGIDIVELRKVHYA